MSAHRCSMGPPDVNGQVAQVHLSQSKRPWWTFHQSVRIVAGTGIGRGGYSCLATGSTSARAGRAQASGLGRFRGTTGLAFEGRFRDLDCPHLGSGSVWDPLLKCGQAFAALRDADFCFGGDENVDASYCTILFFKSSMLASYAISGGRPASTIAPQLGSKAESGALHLIAWTLHSTLCRIFFCSCSFL